MVDTVNGNAVDVDNENPGPTGVGRNASAVFGDRIQRSYRLVSACAWATGVDEQRIGHLADLMLDLDNADLTSLGGPSGLNADGAPLQLCVTLTESMPTFRLIADPASDAVDIRERHARSQNALTALLIHNRAVGMRAPITHLMASIGPTCDAERERFSHGLFWLGAPWDSSGVAVYMDVSMHTQKEGWRIVDGWLPQLKGSGEKGDIPEVVRAHCKISSAGVEGMDAARFRQKLYLYALREIPRGLMNDLLPQLDLFARTGCFRMVMGQSSLALDEVVFNVGMDPVSGAVVDSKIDIWIAGLGIPRKDMTHAIARCCSGLGLQQIDLFEMIRLFDLNYSFLGFGVDKEGRRRLNIYLKGRPE